MTSNLNRKRIVAAKRIVIKIGSILLVDGKSGRLHRDWLEALAKDIFENDPDASEFLADLLRRGTKPCMEILEETLGAL